MDYMTKPVSRSLLRAYSAIFRKILGIPLNGSFPVLEALEKFTQVFIGSEYEVLEDFMLPANVPAQCIHRSDNTFLIQIKESVYNGAYERKTGAFRDHITHELCHAFLFAIGYTPISQRSFKDGEIKAYCSIEWQAKALCGEVMMPYEETIRKNPFTIMQEYGVSKEQAFYRKRY